MPFEPDTELTPVIFRRMMKRHGGEIVALFPTIPGTYDPYTCTDYVHVGQHGSADPQFCIANSYKAKPAEYAELARELESAPYGYRLKIYSRLQPSFLDDRKRALAAMKA